MRKETPDEPVHAKALTNAEALKAVLESLKGSDKKAEKVAAKHIAEAITWLSS